MDSDECPRSQILADHGRDAREARVEFHRRFAFPAACLVFALVALPVGSRPRRGGRAAGFVLAVALVCAYYIIFVFCAALARDGSMPIWLGIWTANILMTVAAIALLPSVESFGGETWLGEALTGLTHWWRRVKAHLKVKERLEAAVSQSDLAAPLEGSRRRYVGGFPQVLDYYLLRNFLFYFLLLLVGFILLFEIFTFFDLLDDIARHRASVLHVANYFRYLGYYLLYQLAPLACLVSILITLGVMTKNNELVAFKAAGISLYRFALPLRFAGGIMAAGLIAFDQSYLPNANQRAEALHRIIKVLTPSQ